MLVRRDGDDAERGGGAIRGRRRGKVHARVLHAGAKGFAQPVLFDLSLENAVAAERGEAGHRIGARAARDLACAVERAMQMDRAVLVDQRHHALSDGVIEQELLADGRQHVHDRVAHSRDVEFVRHALFSPL